MINQRHKTPIVYGTLAPFWTFHQMQKRIYRILALNAHIVMPYTTPDSKVHGPIWGPPGADRTQVGPVLAPWTLLSGTVWYDDSPMVLNTQFVDAVSWDQCFHRLCFLAATVFSFTNSNITEIDIYIYICSKTYLNMLSAIKLAIQFRLQCFFYELSHFMVF